MYTGNAKLKNVEFVNCGQRGYVEDYDPRFALAFMDVGDTTASIDDERTDDSWIRSCSFNNIYNAANLGMDAAGAGQLKVTGGATSQYSL